MEHGQRKIDNDLLLMIPMRKTLTSLYFKGAFRRRIKSDLSLRETYFTLIVEPKCLVLDPNVTYFHKLNPPLLQEVGHSNKDVIKGRWFSTNFFFSCHNFVVDLSLKCNTFGMFILVVKGTFSVLNKKRHQNATFFFIVKYYFPL